jgi:hypothetical protein
MSNIVLSLYLCPSLPPTTLHFHSFPKADADYYQLRELTRALRGENSPLSGLLVPVGVDARDVTVYTDSLYRGYYIEYPGEKRLRAVVVWTDRDVEVAVVRAGVRVAHANTTAASQEAASHAFRNAAVSPHKALFSPPVSLQSADLIIMSPTTFALWDSHSNQVFQAGDLKLRGHASSSLMFSQNTYNPLMKLIF